MVQAVIGDVQATRDSTVVAAALSTLYLRQLHFAVLVCRQRE